MGLSPGDPSAQVRWLDAVAVGWQSKGAFPTLVAWAGSKKLVAGAPAEPTGVQLKAMAATQIFEDVSGTRVRINANSEHLVSGRRPVGLAPRSYSWLCASHDGRYLAAYCITGQSAIHARNTVMIADLQLVGAVNHGGQDPAAVGEVAVIRERRCIPISGRFR